MKKLLILSMFLFALVLSVFIFATASLTSVTINSTNGLNTTAENLTAYPQGGINASVNITDWRVNGISIAILNLPFEANASQNATDYSSYSNNGTAFNNVKWNATGGINGKGVYQFNGINSLVNVTGSGFPSGNKNFSFSFFAKSNSFNGQQVAFAYGEESNPNIIYVDMNNCGAGSRWGVGSWGQSDTICGANAVNVNEWHHVAVTWNTTAATLYQDGVSQGTATSQVYSFINHQVQVGGLMAAGFTGTFFNGSIDEVLVFNKTLSLGEILLLNTSRVITNNILSSNELKPLDNWSACVTPNDGITNGVTVCSNNIMINNTIPVVSFVIQNPSDITSTNVFNPKTLNITYNMTDPELNKSLLRLFWKVNVSNTDSCWIHVNGSGTNCTTNEITYNYNKSDNYTWAIESWKLYPSTSNIPQSIFNGTAHISNTLSLSSSYVKMNFSNITNTDPYNFLTVMINASSGVSPLRMYYCNSSYSTGDPTSASTCSQFATVLNTSYDYCDSTNSCHQIIDLPINTTSKTINGVGVTTMSYILMRGTTGSVWNYYTVANQSTVDTVQTSILSGVTWSNLAGSIDMSLYQFNNSDLLTYYTTANDTLSNMNTSPTRTDTFNFDPLNPEVPKITTPTVNQTLVGVTNINFTPAITDDGDVITYYNISLFNTTLGFVRGVSDNNSLNLGFSWNTSNFTDGTWTLGVRAYDNSSHTSIGFSEQFFIDNTPPFFNQTPTDIVVKYGSAFSMTVNASDNMMFDRYRINDTTNFTINTLNGTIINSSLLSLGNHSLNVTVNDTVNNQNSTIFTVLVNDSQNPALFDPKPSNVTSFNLGDVITISINATDDFLVDKVYANISKPDGTNSKLNLIQDLSTGRYNNTFTLQSAGSYTALFIGNDTSNNVNNTASTQFTSVAPAPSGGGGGGGVVVYQSGTTPQTASGNQSITWMTPDQYNEYIRNLTKSSNVTPAQQPNIATQIGQAINPQDPQTGFESVVGAGIFASIVSGLLINDSIKKKKVKRTYRPEETKY